VAPFRLIFNIKNTIIENITNNKTREVIQDMREPEHYTTAEVAEKLRITRDGVVKRILRGELTAVRSGRRYLIPKATFDALLQPATPDR
jgi:excisionase family DNA binding protein